MADQAANAGVQPVQGDGAGVTNEPQGNLPWDLSAHPEELRPMLAAELKKIEGGVTQKLQEAAELRKQYEPLSGVEGLSEVPAEEIQELLAFRETIQDPAAFEEWWHAVGEELGFFQGDEATDETGGVEEESVPAWAQSLIDDVQALKGTTQQAEASAREQQALQAIEQQLEALKEQHGDFDEDAVCSLAMAYEDDPENAIAKGFADYQRITGKAQSDLVDGAAGQPGPAVSGGSADTAPPAVSWRDGQDPKALAKARFAGAR